MRRTISSAAPSGAEARAHRFIDTAGDLAELIEELRGQPRIALDTEFHRERTYFPQVALVQLAWRTEVETNGKTDGEAETEGGVVDHIALVDPLAVDIAPMAPLLDSDTVWVLHAAQQDLEVLHRSCGTVPTVLFDTQVAAGFLGYSTPSLVNLLTGELGVHVPKADRLTDWLRRPLTEDQCTYAASDVAHLLALHDLLVAQLEAAGRLSWAQEECELLRVRPVGPPDPEGAWLRLKDHRSLRGASRGVAQKLAAWRERRAAALDQPSRFVISDMTILAIAQRPPTNLDDLRRVRGIDERLARGPLGKEVLDAVLEGQALPPSELRVPESDDLDRRLRPAVTLVSAWVSQLAKDERVDTAILATRSDLVDLLRNDPDARLATGWRAEMVGEHIRELVSGRAALAFDGNGNLVLEPRCAPT